MRLKKTTNEKAIHFLQTYKKSDYERPALQRLNVADNIVDDPFSEYRKIVNKSIDALTEVNDLARDVLEDIRPVFIKYNNLLTILQIITVLSSAGTLILFVAETEKEVKIITATLTLIVSVGNVVAKWYVASPFGGGTNKQTLSNDLIELRGESVATKARLQNIIFSEDTISEIRELLLEPSRLIGDMDAIMSRLRIR